VKWAERSRRECKSETIPAAIDAASCALVIATPKINYLNLVLSYRELNTIKY
jgi:hypothetical protein